MFVHIAISSCITYCSDRQVDGAIFALSRRKAIAVALRTCILHKPAQDDHFLQRGKNRFISRATFVTWQKWGEVHVFERITSHTHPDSGGRKIPDLHTALTENCVNTTSTDRHLHLAHYLSTVISYLLLLALAMNSICKVKKNSLSCIKHRPILNFHWVSSPSTATLLIKNNLTHKVIKKNFQGFLYYSLSTE